MSDTTFLPPATPAVVPGTAHPQHARLATSALVHARALTRWWGKGQSAQIGIDAVDLDIPSGELVAIVGPSGSGKSTLGSLLAGIDTPTSGSLEVAGVRIDQLRKDRLADWRGGNVGIVFQDFHLLPTLTAQENVELALKLGRGNAGRGDGRRGRRARRDRARAALAQVGLGPHARKLPAQMSGGEQQRVGIARAIVSDPALLVADEPTGSLDQRNGHAVFDLLAGLAAGGTTVVMITHDLTLASAADRVVTMLDGRVESVAVRGAA